MTALRPYLICQCRMSSMGCNGWSCMGIGEEEEIIQSECYFAPLGK